MASDGLDEFDAVEIKAYLAICASHLRMIFMQQQLGRPLTEIEKQEARSSVSDEIDEALDGKLRLLHQSRGASPDGA
jgi:hypothetical protein